MREGDACGWVGERVCAWEKGREREAEWREVIKEKIRETENTRADFTWKRKRALCAGFLPVTSTQCNLSFEQLHCWLQRGLEFPLSSTTLSALFLSLPHALQPCTVAVILRLTCAFSRLIDEILKTAYSCKLKAHEHNSCFPLLFICPASWPRQPPPPPWFFLSAHLKL